MIRSTKVCAITGANGFVGSRLRHRLQREGWRVVPWTRNPAPGTEAVGFRLGQKVDPALFKGVRALVHCAYDFGPSRRDDIAAVNVAGSEKLLRAAQTAGVPSVVVFSSISAFEGCRSLYGQAKLKIEDLARSHAALVIRSGLVYGDCPGGMFGRLVGQVRTSKLIPVLWGGRQLQYLVQEHDLGNLVQGCLEGRVPPGTAPITIAHEQGRELKDILAQIGQALGKRLSFVPVPWQCVWLGLKSLELVGARPNFKSDSVISIVYQNPQPSFALLKSLGFQCRPFRITPAMLASTAQ
jgi:nucleoside-diphosphate-sugar epimerase